MNVVGLDNLSLVPGPKVGKFSYDDKSVVIDGKKYYITKCEIDGTYQTITLKNYSRDEYSAIYNYHF